MKVLNDLVLIKPKEEEKSVLVTPNSSKEFPQEGTVIGHGPEVEIEDGDEVVYRKWTGDIVNIEGVDFVVVRFEDVLLILDKKKNV